MAGQYALRTTSRVYVLSLTSPKGRYRTPALRTIVRDVISESTGNIYIGVVDDDESMRRSLVRLLRAAGYCPIAYESAETFLADLKRPVFDCLVLDVHLDDVSGTELAEKLASSGSKVPVIFLSAVAPEDVARTLPPDSRFVILHKGQPGSLLLDAIRNSVCRRENGASAPIS